MRIKGVRVLAVILCCMMIIPFFGCQKEEPVVPTKTLMVYMIGSDLEAKGGSATNDLEEMAASGVDLTNVNVIVYAGGSKKWHSDNVSSEGDHTVLKLTDSGFTKVTTMTERSMGEADCLADFLNYAYKNYPADSFSLILWDHGNGPLIGYGKDMMFDDDSLTLVEMKQALKASPFSGENKLSWVGFDACLMASAELACVWKDHADFLVASQEIEPSFGWNYSFLSSLNGEQNALFEKITGDYFTACEDYYKKKGFDDRDTTLSCMDLSYASQLETALNGLFSKAKADVNSSFSNLSQSRVNTRALGRASTGSEYDLIDLYDMTEQMSASYSDETAKIQAVLNKMIIKNRTNTENLCGMSLYYPFYNKSYYKKSWGETYSQLGVLSDYASYLDEYTKIWLDDNLLEESAESNKPEEGGTGKYTLELTDEQAQNFASARYYIMMREGEELYTMLYSSAAVTKNGNTLTAAFDGDILYAKDGIGNMFIPVTKEHDTVGDITRYSIYVNLTTSLIYDLYSEEESENRVAGHRFHIAANTQTKEIAKSALVPYDMQMDENTLMGGKVEDADISQWDEYWFLQEGHRYVERYDNGAIKPVYQWPKSSYASAFVTKVQDGIDFMFAPLVAGEYCLVFEIEDVQGNRYSSELISFESDYVFEEEPEAEYTELTWHDGSEVKLFEEQGVTAWLTTIESYGDTIYSLRVSNKNDFGVIVSVNDLFYDNVYCPDAYMGFIMVGAGKTVTDDFGVNFGDVYELGLLNSDYTIKSLKFNISVETETGDKTLVNKKPISVSLSEKTNFLPSPLDPEEDWLYYNPFDKATRGLLAGEQVLFNKDGLKATILGFGGDGTADGALTGALKLENTSSQDKVLAVDGYIFDGIYIEKGSGPITVPAGCILYERLYISDDDMDNSSVLSPSSLTVCVRFMKYETLQGGGGSLEWVKYPVKLSQKGTGCTLATGSNLVYNEKNIKIYLEKTIEPLSDKDYQNYYEMRFVIVNESDRDVTVTPDNYRVNSVKVPLSIDSSVYHVGGMCPDGTKSVMLIRCYNVADSIDFESDIYIYDIMSEKILFPDAVKTLKIKVK